VLARFGTASEPSLREQVANAFYNKGVILNRLGRRKKAIATFDELLTQFGTAFELVIRERVAGALIAKGNALDELGRSDEAIAAYDEVLARFGTTEEGATFEDIVANARFRHVSLQRARKKSDRKRKRK
jgi:tetratricopeptide (TPR) repeat protein